jgi:hypothetical protein
VLASWQDLTIVRQKEDNEWLVSFFIGQQILLARFSKENGKQ